MTYWIHEMKYQEIEEYLKKNDIVLIPVGSTEQHGPHLPLMMDTIEAIDVTAGVIEKTGVLATPPVWFGWSPHHMGYPGTITLRPETLTAVVEDIGNSLVYNGFKKLVVVNGHREANLPPLDIAAVKIRNRTGAYVAVVDIAFIALKEIQEICEGEVGSIGHGCESETSFMLYKHPEFVDMSQAVKALSTSDPKFTTSSVSVDARFDYNRFSFRSTPEEQKQDRGFVGSRGDPTLASREKGQKIFEVIVDNIVEFIDRIVRPAQVEIKAKFLPV
jgi:creatinine amidohydrolase